ncbi:MAG: host-nuclease inhibitor Gam family protein [Magnetococcales bacterium]|nr:host-nuclease inhibitor Gam family protein [Magnetococcales bacterium]
MASKKTTDTAYIADLDHASEALREMAEIQRRLGLAEARQNSSIDAIKKRIATITDTDRKRLEALQKGLQLYADRNRDLFKDRRSVSLPFGDFGYRWSTSIVPATSRTTWKMILGKLKELALTTAINKTEQVNKEILGTWPDERLTLVGAQREQKEIFFVEVKKEEVEGAA